MTRTIWHVAWGTSTIRMPKTRLGRALLRARLALGRIPDAWGVLTGKLYIDEEYR